MDEALTGVVLATVAKLQQLLTEAQGHRQKAFDGCQNAEILLNNERKEVARLNKELSKTEQLAKEAQHRTQQYEWQYTEAQDELKGARAGDFGAQRRADKVAMELLEHQLTDTRQQLQLLRESGNLGASQEQLAAQQTRANEQLVALQHEEAARMAAERNIARRKAANLLALSNKRIKAANSLVCQTLFFMRGALRPRPR